MEASIYCGPKKKKTIFNIEAEIKFKKNIL
jgi:hypothetical protein